MINTNKQLNNMLGGFCVGPTPILWKSLFFIIPIMTAVLIALSLFILVEIYRNKNKKGKILTKDLKKQFLYLIVLALSLLTYGLVGLSFEFYLLVFFFICVWILFGFFIGEHWKLIKVGCSAWFAVAAVAMVFALLFGICYLGSVKERIETRREVRLTCHGNPVF